MNWEAGWKKGKHFLEILQMKAPEGCSLYAIVFGRFFACADFVITLRNSSRYDGYNKASHTWIGWKETVFCKEHV